MTIDRLFINQDAFGTTGEKSYCVLSGAFIKGRKRPLLGP